MADMLDKLVMLAVSVIVYFGIFGATVTSIQTVNWTALELEWVPTILIILLALIPVIALIYEVKKTKGK